MMKHFFFTLCLSLISLVVNAQQKFAEGTLVYNITITGKVPTPANEPAITETKSGTLTILLKEENIRQDITLEDGYKHSRISNYANNKELILQTINTIKYAIEINLNDLLKKNSIFYNAVLQTDGNTRNVNSFDAVSATLTYKNGVTFPFYYLKDYELKYPQIFERMPELKGIPASFDLVMSNDFITHFELKSITATPVPNAAFRIPEGYRIISKKEYDKLIR